MVGFFVTVGCMTSFAELTTMDVGGYIERFVEPTTRVALIEEVEDADSKGIPLCVIGGGSNMLASDDEFHGVVIRDARRNIIVPDEAAPVEGGDYTVHVNAEAGVNWDDLVQFCVERGLEGLEGLSGIPGTVGASVVQNIGAYGQEVASAVESVEVWDPRGEEDARYEQCRHAVRLPVQLAQTQHVQGSWRPERAVLPDAALYCAVRDLRTRAHRNRHRELPAAGERVECEST